MANDIYNYGQRRTSINNPFTGESDWFNNVTEAPMGKGIINTGVGDQFANARQAMTSNQAYRGTFPGQRFPHEGMEVPGFMEEPSGVGEGYDKRRIRDVIGDKFKGLATTP